MHPSNLKLYPSFRTWVESSFSNITEQEWEEVMIDDRSYNYSSDMEHYEDSESGSTGTDGLNREYNEEDESQMEETWTTE